MSRSSTTSLGPMTTTISLKALAEAAGDVLVRIDGEDTAAVAGVSYDSRKVGGGDLFFCIPGTVTDGHRFGPSAAAAGAAALCVERILDVDVPQVLVSDARVAMARMAAAFYGDPSRDLMMLGVTGTNGKTTTAFLIESILTAAGHTPGLIGTIETRVAGKVKPGVRTTPESLDLQALLAEMRDAGSDSVAMEVTSHALEMARVEGVGFRAAAFTNLSQDHLDFHPDMESYFAAKAKLFEPGRTAAGAVNIDDPYGRKLLASAGAPVIGFGEGSDASVRATDVDLGTAGSSFTLVFEDVVGQSGKVGVTTRLAGRFNISNCLAAASVALLAGIPPEQVAAGIEGLRAVPGRFEAIDGGQPFSVIVDYAHTPDSLENVLRAARPLASKRVICVFGCGGDRDRGKRPLMGAAVARLADVCIVTSDNPRSEEPAAILEEIVAGVKDAGGGPDLVEVDRRVAISSALEMAGEGDCVVIAGKGHETGQQFATETIPFDDRLVARDALAEFGWSDAS